MDANRNRSELKFLLPCGVAGDIWSCVSEHLEPDRGEVGGYSVVSEYFDTADRHSYWQREMGVPCRRRMRLRIYGEADSGADPDAFLEIKQRADGMSVKRRLALSLPELHRVAEGHLPEERAACSWEESRALAEARDLLVTQGARPVLQTRYHRFAFDTGPEGSIRVTIDRDPCCRISSEPLQPNDPEIDLPLVDEGCAIMEVKTTDSVPVWLRRLAGEHRLVPRGFSKYATALDLYEFGRYTLGPSLRKSMARS